MSEVPLQARTGPRRGWGGPASGPLSERGGGGAWSGDTDDRSPVILHGSVSPDLPFRRASHRRIRVQGYLSHKKPPTP